MALMQARSRLVAVLIAAPLSLFAQTPQTLDATGDVGKYTSIAVDATNSPHISYYDATNRDLKGVWKSGIWYAGPVHQTGNVGEYTSIAVTSAPILKFISYYDGGNEYLNLAYQETTGATAAYTFERLPVSVRLLARSSLALNLSSVIPIIAFFDVNDRTLKLALFNRGSTFSSPPLSYPKWGVETVATAPTNVEDLALEVRLRRVPLGQRPSQAAGRRHGGKPRGGGAQSSGPTRAMGASPCHQPRFG